jgi:hypothetical protein
MGLNLLCLFRYLSYDNYKPFGTSSLPIHLLNGNRGSGFNNFEATTGLKPSFGNLETLNRILSSFVIFFSSRQILFGLWLSTMESTFETTKRTDHVAEKPASLDDRKQESASTGSVIETQSVPLNGFRGFLDKLVKFGRVEIRGIAPIPVEERTVTRTINIFTLWWCMNANILP